MKHCSTLMLKMLGIGSDNDDDGDHDDENV